MAVVPTALVDSARVFVPEIDRLNGTDLGSRMASLPMVVVALFRTRLTRVLATLIVMLAVCPYSQPFTTIDWTKSAASNIVDEIGAKLKAPALDALIPTPAVFVALVNGPDARLPLGLPDCIHQLRDQRAILRL
jgi:hypothetical protein